jgi:hypothetical protein
METKDLDSFPEFGKLIDNGERLTFSAGGVREPATGKGRYDLLPGYPIKRLAILYEKGCLKYPSRNWEKGMPLSRCMDSALRHLNQFSSGDRSEDHLTQAVWNLFAYIELEKKILNSELPTEFYDVDCEPSVPGMKRRKTETLIEETEATQTKSVVE